VKPLPARRRGRPHDLTPHERAIEHLHLRLIEIALARVEALLPAAKAAAGAPG
jgi:hypothetical protein